MNELEKLRLRLEAEKYASAVHYSLVCEKVPANAIPSYVNVNDFEGWRRAELASRVYEELLEAAEQDEFDEKKKNEYKEWLSRT